jgi:hypothetical protein
VEEQYSKNVKLLRITFIPFLFSVSLVILILKYESPVETEYYWSLKNKNFANSDLNITLNDTSLSYISSKQTMSISVKSRVIKCEIGDNSKFKIILNNHYIECLYSKFITEKYGISEKEFNSIKALIVSSGLEFSLSNGLTTINYTSFIQYLFWTFFLIIYLSIIALNWFTLKNLRRNKILYLNVVGFVIFAISFIPNKIDSNNRQEQNYSQIGVQNIDKDLYIPEDKFNPDFANFFLDMNIENTSFNQSVFLQNSKKLFLEINEDSLRVYIPFIDSSQKIDVDHNCQYNCNFLISILNKDKIVITTNSKISLLKSLNPQIENLDVLSSLRIDSSQINSGESFLRLETVDESISLTQLIEGMIYSLFAILVFLPPILYKSINRKTVK